jgi:PDZ domain-containing protein
VWWLLSPLMAIVVVATAVVGFQRFPYSVLAPGDATAGEPLVQIKGHPSYKHKGELLFVTVNVRDQVSGAEAVYGWLRGDQAVFPSHDVIGSHTPQEDFRSSVLDMRQSKEAAVVLALRHLGMQVPEVDRGALVVDVSRGTPAYGKLGIGDSITGIDGAAVANVADLRRILATHKPGDRVTLSTRSFRQTTAVGAAPGAARDVSITLASYPAEDGQSADPHRAFLGITPVTDAKFTLPFPLDIDTGPVGGPSAGLAFTLTLIDRLSPAGILHGHKVAVTGTIDLDGRVGPVGGVPQKTITVRRAGVQLFIVPSSEYAEAKANAGSMRVEKADTLEQALRILRDFGG